MKAGWKFPAAAFLLSTAISAAAQVRHVSSEAAFVDYLVGNDMAEDAVTLLSRDIFHPSDTLSYLRGWVNYNTQRLSEATKAFDEVPPASPFYDKAFFFNVISNAHLGNYERCSGLLESYDGPYSELRALEEAGIALLRDRPEDFICASRTFSLSSFALSDSEMQLKRIYDARYTERQKRPYIAAAASAVIPGLGKVYAGELAEGISSFVVTGALAAIVAENWSKHGPGNWKTIAFGTLGAAFYIGNIYGSYFSVSIHNKDLKNAQDTTVLYHIHIPLRSIFN